MLPRQPCSRYGAWHTVTHPGHGGAECARADHRVGQACLRSLRVDGYVVRDPCLHNSGHRQHLPAVEGNASTQAGSLRHGECLQPSLTQRDMWVMHRSPVQGISLLLCTDDGVRYPAGRGSERGNGR